MHTPTLFIAMSFILAKMQNQPRCPSIDEWIKNMWHIIQWNITQP